MVKNKFVSKLASFIATFSLLLNTFAAPAVVLAQEASPTPEPTPVATATPEVSPEPALIPTSEPTVLPDATIEPSVEPTASAEASATPEATVEETQTGEITTTVLESVDFSNVTSLDESSTVTTDKADYSPTETVVITGSELEANTSYTLVISSGDDPAVRFETQVTTDESGSFVYLYQLDGNYRPNYLIEVYLGSVLVTSVTFTDAKGGGPGPSADLDQCANGGVGDPAVPCDGSAWQNGNLNHNQAHYFEGQFVPYRMRFDHLTPGGSNTITIGYDTTKSGKHAIDYLGTYDATETTGNNPCSGVSGCSLATYDTETVPVDSNVTNGQDGIFGTGDDITQILGVFTLFGGTITGVSSYTLIGPYSGDSETQITVTFSPSVENPVLAWGGHIGSQIDWGVGNSAVDINGSPYHMRNRGLDGGGGNQDRSLSSSAVLPATGNISIIKDSVPNDGQDFSFSTTVDGVTGFSLDDDLDDTLSNIKTFTGLTADSTYTFTEGLVSGWRLTNITCDGQDSPINLDARTATVNLADNENVVCTFTNTKEKGTLEVVKVVEPSDNSQWDISINQTKVDTLGDGESTGVLSYDVGSYTIEESGTNNDYYTSSYSCTDGNQLSLVGKGRSVNVELGFEQDIVCTFTNSLNLGSIQGRKYDDANQNGTLQDGEIFLDDWTINLYDDNWGALGSFNTGDTGEQGQYNFSNLAPGTYNVCEVSQNGWSQTGPLSGSHPVNYQGSQVNSSTAVTNVSPNNSNEGSTCWQASINGDDLTWMSFGNVQQGTIRVEKVINPSNSQETFEFTTNYDDNFLLGHNGYNESGYLNPDNYSVEEIVPVLGWADPEISCSSATRGGIDNTNIDLHEGENVTCVFTNTQYSSISGYKYIDADGILGTTNDRTPYNGWLMNLFVWNVDNWTSVGTDTTDSNGYYEFLNLLPGLYQVREGAKTGWTNVSATTQDVQLAAGEENTGNNFVNTKYGSIQGRKYNDVNGNGDFDQSEKTDENRLDGWTITLYDDGWQQKDSMLTGQDGTAAGNVNKGQYRFVNVYPGTYYVCETPQAGWVQTEPASSYPHDDAYCHMVEVSSGEAVTGIQFGNFEEGQISGHKFNDLDGNGVWDQGEPAIEGWEISLDGPGGSDSTFTDSSGYYSFSDLGPGQYTVSEEHQTNWQQTAPNGDTFVIDMTSGGDFGDNDFGNQGWGTVTVNKDVDTDGDGKVDVSGSTDWIWELNTADHKTGDTVDVPAGVYSISEIQKDGYHFVSLFCDVQEIDGDTTRFEVDPGDDVVCTYTNARDTGLIIIHKIIDVDGNPETIGDQSDGEDWQFDVDGTSGDVSDPLAQNTNASGSATFNLLKTGEYTVVETTQDGYDLVDAYCDNGSFDQIDSVDGIDVDVDETVECTFINSPNGSIHGYKWEDVNGNGHDDEENLLGDWTIYLYKYNGEGYEPFATTQTESDQQSQHFGWYLFSHLFPGDYKVCEELQNGWSQTFPGNGCYLISIPDSNEFDFQELTNATEKPTPVYNFGNQEIIVDLGIEKSNDRPTANKGDTVTYTLKVTNNGNQTVGNLVIKDVLPGGFEYVTGSTLINNLADSDPTISGGVLSWNIGSLDPEQSVKVVYQAKISSDVADGTYTNLATCTAELSFGERVLVRLSEEFEEGVECNVADSSVRIGSNPSFGGNLSPQVLGASTELPASGSRTEILIAAVAMIGLGVAVKVVRKKYAQN